MDSTQPCSQLIADGGVLHPHTQSKSPEWSLTLLSPTAFTQSSRKPSSHFLSSHLDSLSHLRWGPHLLCLDFSSHCDWSPGFHPVLPSQFPTQQPEWSSETQVRSCQSPAPTPAKLPCLTKSKGQRPAKPSKACSLVTIPNSFHSFSCFSVQAPQSFRCPPPREHGGQARGGFALDALSAWQSSPHISKSYSLLPASFSQMLISPKTYSDHPCFSPVRLLCDPIDGSPPGSPVHRIL